MASGGEQKAARALVPGAVDVLVALFALPLLWVHALLTEDTWWHLALGRTTDWHTSTWVESFSHTAVGAPLSSHSWLFDALLWLLERAGGLGLVEVAGFLLVALTFRAVFALGRELGARPSFALVAVFFFAVSSAHFLTLRPQLVTYLFLAGLLLACLRRRTRSAKELRAVPALFLLWSNLHGGFLIGLALLLGFSAVEAFRGREDPAARARARTFALLALVGAAAACVHPNGWHQFTDALENTPAGDRIHTLINEWRPPDLSVVPLLSVSIVAAFAIALVQGERPPLLEALLVLGTLFLALSAWRHVPVFGVVGAPILAAWASRAFSKLALAARLEKLERVLGSGGGAGWLLVVLVALGLGARELVAPSDVLAARLVRKKFPVEAVRWMATQSSPGKLWNTYDWGGYLEHELPREKVFIDSRMVPFKGVLEDYCEIAAGGPGALALLDRYAIARVLAARSSPLEAALERDGRWKRAYGDERACVFVRAP